MLDFMANNKDEHSRVYFKIDYIINPIDFSFWNYKFGVVIITDVNKLRGGI